MHWKDQKVLVTGGAGFIGQNLIKEFLKRRTEVIVIDNFSYGLKENIPKECSLIKGDVRDESIFRKLPKYIDYVFHFAAPSSIILFKESPQECIDITINGLKSILNWSIRNNVKKVIYPSSGSVYGKTAIPQRETDIPKPVNIYGKTKLVCEYLAKIYSEWIPNIGLRIFAGYGPGEEYKGDFASVVTLFLKSILKDESPVIYGDGNQKRDFVYIGDVVKAIIKSTEINQTGVINVGLGKSYSFNELIHIINHLIGKKINPRYIKKPTDYLENTLADIANMEDLLKVNPLSLEEGLERYLANKDLQV